jgi:hypothetical protein
MPSQNFHRTSPKEPSQQGLLSHERQHYLAAATEVKSFSKVFQGLQLH